jgi:small subunit ribosomal protein S27Ae
MQLFAKTLSGATVCVAVDAAATAAAVRAALGLEAGVQLACGFALLKEGAPLAAQGVLDGSSVYALAPVDGGKKKKKKKKIFKGPKKPTHRHKNVPMRVLKFYKVEGDGEDTEYKVTHDRIECPHPNCGAGVFMAVHKDRQTCGKCSLTYVFQKK